jgi:acetyl-CoA acetyltransferase family protein
MVVDRGDNECYIVDYCRSAFSRSNPSKPEKDAFGEIRGDMLLGYVLKNLFEERMKDKVNASEVDEFLMGTALQVHENWGNGGNLGWYLAGLPWGVPSLTFERECGSSMSAMHHGIMQIWTDMADIIVAGGMEHMTRVSMDPVINKHFLPPMELCMEKPGEPNPWFRADLDMMTSFQMINTAQKLFEEEWGGPDQVTQEEMQDLAVRSHKLTAEGYASGFFKGEIVPIMGHKPGNIEEEMLVDKDLSLREGTTKEKLASLRGASTPGYLGGFKKKLATSYLKRKQYKTELSRKDGVITAGVSSPLNAGAVAVMMMSKKKMLEKGLKPLAKVVSIGWGGVRPSVMGRGPVPATKMALKKAGLTVEDIDYWEINEAFAVVVLNACNKLGIDVNKVNVHGGAMSIGHPLGASGSRLPGTLARILKEKKARYGVATLCCGGGQGTTVILENEEWDK